MNINKKGVELPINVMIILILAILVLGIVVFLVSGTSRNIMNIIENYPKLEIPPDSNNPISFIPSVIERGKSNKMTIGFYNGELEDVSKSVIPRIICNGIPAVSVKTVGLVIPVGYSGTYSALITVPKTTIPDNYACSMIISKTEKSFFMKVE